jgi:carbamoyl-phosphate synthase large subunit
MKILVTGAGALLGQGIIKSLRITKRNYHIVAVDPDPRAVGLYWADKAYLVPFATEPDYLDRVCQVINKERPDAVLIGTDVELMAFSVNKIEIESNYNTHVIVSPTEVIKIADDKWQTYQFLLANGFPYPRSALPDDLSDLLRECDFPLIVKPRSGARSIGVHEVRNKAELSLALTKIYDPIIQESVSSFEQEYTSGIVIVHGAVQAITTMRRDLKDGNTFRAYVEPDSSFDDLLSNIAEKLGGLGPVNFQFRSCDGVPKIFEINARFSGTTPIRAYAGFNEVDCIVRYVVLGEDIPKPRLQPLVVLRYWNEVLIDGEYLSILRDAGSLISPKCKTGFQTS